LASCFSHCEKRQGIWLPHAAAGSHYKSINDLMKRRIEPSFRALLTAGLELADSFLRLHAKGLCYRDILFGNVFFEPDTGKISIMSLSMVREKRVARDTTFYGTGNSIWCCDTKHTTH